MKKNPIDIWLNIWWMSACDFYYKFPWRFYPFHFSFEYFHSWCKLNWKQCSIIVEQRKENTSQDMKNNFNYSIIECFTMWASHTVGSFVVHDFNKKKMRTWNFEHKIWMHFFCRSNENKRNDDERANSQHQISWKTKRKTWTWLMW